MPKKLTEEQVEERRKYYSTPETSLKTCAECGEEKTLTNFNYNGLDNYGFNRYRPTCRECLAHVRHSYYERNKEEITRRHRRYMKNLTPLSRMCLLKAKTANKASKTRYGRNDTITAKDIHDAFHSQGGKCYLCGKSIKRSFHLEHVIPMFQGGRNSASNIKCSCATCNLQKNARTPEEYAIHTAIKKARIEEKQRKDKLLKKVQSLPSDWLELIEHIPKRKLEAVAPLVLKLYKQTPKPRKRRKK